jgi:hypothetical protein
MRGSSFGSGARPTASSPSARRHRAYASSQLTFAPRTGRTASAIELRRRIEACEWVVDLRARRVFAAGHLDGTLSFDLDGSLATYLAWLIPSRRDPERAPRPGMGGLPH